MTFRLAIVGRPNVGKSTLFNRLVGKRLALVDDLPGVTRDWREGRARLGDLEFAVIDTAGLEQAASDSLTARMQKHTEAAVASADAVVFLIDARAGVSPADRAFADLVRKSGKPAIVAANKSEGRGAQAGVLEAYELGLGEPVAISAEHGEGLADLYEAVRAALPDATGPPSSAAEDAGKFAIARRCSGAAAIRIAVVGRPNSGKSTLDQPPGGRGAAAHRARGRHYPRCHRGRSAMARPALPRSRYGRAAAAVAHRGEAREALGR